MREISIGHYEQISKKGGKYPMVIMSNFQKREENVNCHSDQFSKTREKCPMIIMSNFQKWWEIVYLQF